VHSAHLHTLAPQMEVANSVVWMFWWREKATVCGLHRSQTEIKAHSRGRWQQHLPARAPFCARREAPRHVRRAGMAVEENVEAALRAAGGVGDERVAVVLAVRERPLATSDPSHAKPAPLS
jgi:hypothetical protein